MQIFDNMSEWVKERKRTSRAMRTLPRSGSSVNT